MIRFGRYCLGLLCCLILLRPALPAHAEDYTPPKAVVETAKKLEGNGAKIRAYFPTPIGLVGIVSTMDKKHRLGLPQEDENVIYFLDPTGRYLLAGAFLDLKENRNIVQEAARTYGTESGEDPAPKTKPPSLSSLFYVEHQPSKNGRYIYIFVDPMCPHCRRQVAAITEAITSKSLPSGIRWVPVSLGDPLSTSAAALILGSKDRLTEFQKVFSGPPPTIEGIKKTFEKPEMRSVIAIGTFCLERNLSYLTAQGTSGVPFALIIEDGKLKRIHYGYANLEQLGLK